VTRHLSPHERAVRAAGSRRILCRYGITSWGAAPNEALRDLQAFIRRRLHLADAQDPRAGTEGRR